LVIKYLDIMVQNGYTIYMEQSRLEKEYKMNAKTEKKVEEITEMCYCEMVHPDTTCEYCLSKSGMDEKELVY